MNITMKFTLVFCVVVYLADRATACTGALRAGTLSSYDPYQQQAAYPQQFAAQQQPPNQQFYNTLNAPRFQPVLSGTTSNFQQDQQFQQQTFQQQTTPFPTFLASKEMHFQQQTTPFAGFPALKCSPLVLYPFEIQDPNVVYNYDYSSYTHQEIFDLGTRNNVTCTYNTRPATITIYDDKKSATARGSAVSAQCTQLGQAARWTINSNTIKYVDCTPF